ncbi:hypothetical protein FRUB_03631 [Fimbriiglobus ruber]|uniref:Uncharacterized protein n=1 Tax=Fimbriiglobus ruber TaxID=1908690 RepID=A0A225DRK5_9BACT|nr:hypothetical protein FRUB_03631 [Fimbriiglobus ruber]
MLFDFVFPYVIFRPVGLPVVVASPSEWGYQGRNRDSDKIAVRPPV